MAEDRNELEEAFEDIDTEQEDEQYDPWDEAHDMYVNENDPTLLENMIDQVSKSHALDAVKKYDGALSKKGRYLDYDEWHALSASAAIVGLSYVWHPIALTLWAYITKQIIDHSLVNCKEADPDHWIETIDVFGKEIWYYMGGGLFAAWFFEEFTAYSLQIGDAGTLATIGLEAAKIFAGA